MSAPFYFFPRLPLTALVGPQGLSATVLKRYGLQDVLGDMPIGQFSRQELTTLGPGNASGALITYNVRGQPPKRFGYVPDVQEWHLVLAEPELWVGFDHEERPSPGDLARPRQIPGHLVTLTDGADYLVPVIRTPDPDYRWSADVPGSRLPQDMWLDAKGELRFELRAEWRELWEATALVWDAFSRKPLQGGRTWTRACLMG